MRGDLLRAVEDVIGRELHSVGIDINMNLVNLAIIGGVFTWAIRDYLRGEKVGEVFVKPSWKENVYNTILVVLAIIGLILLAIDQSGWLSFLGVSCGLGFAIWMNKLIMEDRIRHTKEVLSDADPELLKEYEEKKRSDFTRLAIVFSFGIIMSALSAYGILMGEGGHHR